MFSVERGGILQMALLLLSHAIAYDCYCYCNPLSEQSTERAALSLMAAWRWHQKWPPRFRGFAILPPSLSPYVCLYMFTGSAKRLDQGCEKQPHIRGVTIPFFTGSESRSRIVRKLIIRLRIQGQGWNPNEVWRFDLKLDLNLDTESPKGL